MQYFQRVCSDWRTGSIGAKIVGVLYVCSGGSIKRCTSIDLTSYGTTGDPISTSKDGKGRSDDSGKGIPAREGPRTSFKSESSWLTMMLVFNINPVLTACQG